MIFRSSDIPSLVQKRHLARLLPSSYGSGKKRTFAIRLDCEDMYLGLILIDYLCRYSAFLLLYPTGISSELGLIYTAMPYMKVSLKQQKHSITILIVSQSLDNITLT